MIKYNISSVSEMLYQAEVDFNIKRDYRDWSAVIEVVGVDVYFLFDDEGRLISVRGRKDL
jgi:hypothetical protein